MPMDKIVASLQEETESYHASGRAKQPERPITGYIPPASGRGPRYTLAGSNEQFLRMNSNSYLDLSMHPKLIAAADDATHRLGVGPGAVRFIDGTFQEHVDLEKRIAAFVGKPAARVFNSAYTTNLACALTLASPETYWVGDELNHNSIIRAMRISNVPKTNRAIFPHNDLDALRKILEEVPSSMTRVLIIFDGIFSMRGDAAPMAGIQQLARDYQDKFEHGVITIVDDSHGIAAFGASGRGTCEYSQTQADIVIGTFGKAFGVNGGFVCSEPELVELMRHKADTYIYTNPLSPCDCAAARAAIDVVDSDDGRARLRTLADRVTQFRQGLLELGLESIPGPHPVVPVLVRDTKAVHARVKNLFDNQILAVGLTFPVVPEGSETIRFQVNAGLTEQDIEYVLSVLSRR